jgi:predicted AAA+ superfamily ATPase
MKLYFLDVGLYNAATGLEWEELFKLPAEELLTKGFLAEQFIAQHLVFRRGDTELTELYYWLRGGKEGAAEIDFLIAEKGRIYPVEVKSGATGKMRSLWQYVAAKGAKVVVRFDLSERKSFVSKVKQRVVTGEGTKEIETDMLCLPVYAISSLSRVLDEYSAR